MIKAEITFFGHQNSLQFNTIHECNQFIINIFGINDYNDYFKVTK